MGNSDVNGLPYSCCFIFIYTLSYYGRLDNASNLAVITAIYQSKDILWVSFRIVSPIETNHASCDGIFTVKKTKTTFII